MTARRVAAALLLAAATGAHAARPTVYVALGGEREGAAARLAGRLEAAGRRVRAVDLTAPDATLRDVRERQLPRALALRPSLVTLAVGDVDVRGPSPSLRRFSRDLQVVADLLRRARADAVVVSTIPPPARAPGRAARALRRRVDAFNWAIVRIARRHGFAVVDPGAARGTRWEDVVGPAVERALAPDAPRAGADRAGVPAAAIRRRGDAHHPRAAARVVGWSSPGEEVSMDLQLLAGMPSALTAIREFHRLKTRRERSEPLTLREARMLATVRELLEPRAGDGRRARLMIESRRRIALRARGVSLRGTLVGLALRAVHAEVDGAVDPGEWVRVAIPRASDGRWHRFHGRVARVDRAGGLVTLAVAAPAGVRRAAHSG